MINKKIHSEINFYDTDFKVKICTTNKKNPEIVYIQLGTYLKPLEKKSIYTNEIDFFDKNSKKFLRNKLKHSLSYDNDFIFIIDIADERMNIDKKSFLDIQIHIKRSNNDEKNFKNISKKLYNECVLDFISFIKENLNDIGFEYFKNKN